MEEKLDQKAVGERMRQAAEAKQLDPYEVARALQRKPPTVYRWYTGETRPANDDLNAFAALVGKPVIEILFGVSLPRLLLRWATLAEQIGGSEALARLRGQTDWDESLRAVFDRLAPDMLAMLSQMAGGDWRRLPEAEQLSLMQRLLSRLVDWEK